MDDHIPVNVVTSDTAPPEPSPTPAVEPSEPSSTELPKTTLSESVPTTPSPVITPPVKVKHAHKFIFGYMILIVLVAAVAGIYEWQHKKVTSLNSQLSSLQKQQTTDTKQITSLNSEVKNLQAAAISKSSISYLPIKELGVELPLSSGISDLVYLYVPSSNLLYFSTASLDKISPNCALSSSANFQGPFGHVLVETSPLPTNEVGTTDGQDGTLYSHVNGYYLYWKGSQSSCQQTEASGGAVSQTDSNLLTTQSSLFLTALKNTQAL